MKNSNLFAALIVFAAMAIIPAPLRAQTGVAEAVAAPIIVRTLTPKKKVPEGNWMKAQVIHADAVSIIVNEVGNQKLVHTFTYSLALKPRMQQILDAGGYHYGDQIKILYEPNSTVALKIHGKPSKTS